MTSKNYSYQLALLSQHALESLHMQ
ncbi:hypothetical protein EMIT0P171_180105 [Pseudomonas sp. IT-P171]